MEIIPNHVVNQVHADPERWKQLMNYFQKLVYFTDLGNYVMEAIMWRVSYEFTKFQATNTHLGQDALYLQVAILGIQHLVDKLTK
jgi:hypothetical protein